MNIERACKLAAIPLTSRQERKWDRQRGIAWKVAHRGAAKNERIEIQLRQQAAASQS